MQKMWKNVLIFLNCKAVAKILPAMSGKAETLTWRVVSKILRVYICAWTMRCSVIAARWGFHRKNRVFAK